MTKLTLTNHAQSTTTVLENEFIDQHMAKANGEYVKVYLLLLRHLHTASGTLTISEIADKLECTEKDVTRALNYWKTQGLLDYAAVSETKSEKSEPSENTHSEASSLAERPASVPAATIQKCRKNKEFKQLIFNKSKVEKVNFDADFVTEERHFYALKDASNSLKSAIENIGVLPLDIVTVDIKDAWHYLGLISGQTSDQAVIDEIFAKFCVGK